MAVWKIWAWAETKNVKPLSCCLEISHWHFSKSFHCPKKLHKIKYPEGPARHLNALRQKLTPNCRVTTFDAQLSSPESSLRCPPPKIASHPQERELFSAFKMAPAVRAIARQLSGKSCLAALRCLSGPSGYFFRRRDLPRLPR